MLSSVKKLIALLSLFLIIGTIASYIVPKDSRFSAGRAVLNAAGGIADPDINYPSGTYGSGLRIRITATTPDSIIYYTTDGSEPSDTHGTQYSGPFGINYNATLRAVACKTPLCSSSTDRSYVFSSSHAGGGGTSNPSDVPGGPSAPTCDDDPKYCPPEAPKSGVSFDPVKAPTYGNILSNGESPFYRNLTIGSRGSDVYALQQFLYGGGFLRVAPTGYFGDSTKEAVSAFQRSAVIFPSSGFVGSLTISKINSRLELIPRSRNGGSPSPEKIKCPGSPSIFYPDGSCSACFYSGQLGWLYSSGTTIGSGTNASCGLASPTSFDLNLVPTQ